MNTDGFESLILFVSDLAAARAFYVEGLGLPLLFEDEIIVVVGGQSGRIVLHRNDKGHDERGIFPAGDGVDAPSRYSPRASGQAPSEPSSTKPCPAIG